MRTTFVRPLLALLAAATACALGLTACEAFSSTEDVITLDELNGVANSTSSSGQKDTSASSGSGGSTSSSSSSASSSSSSTSGSSSSGGSSTSGGSNSTGNTSSLVGFSGVKWLATDVSGWSQTASLSASITGSEIKMNYNKSRVWPAVDGVNANPWAIVNIGGKWYAGTFEWLRYGQTSKPKAVLDGSKGDHFKKAPLSSWQPQAGERFGIMVSGLARTSTRNVKERSNVSMVTWK